MKDLLSNPYAIKGIISLTLVIVAMLVIKIGKKASPKEGRRATEVPYVVQYVTVCILILVLAYLWLDGIAPMLTALTIVAAALTIVCKEIILNLAGSMIIFWRELFEVGDRVQIGDHSGDVIAKGAFYFTLLEAGAHHTTEHSTGRLIKVPNGLVLTIPVANATRGAGYVWHEITISVIRDSNWEKAQEALLESAKDYMDQESIDLERVKRSFERHKIFYRTLSPRVYLAIQDDKVTLKLRYISRSRMTRDSEDAIIRNFLNSPKALEIELAPKRRS